MVSFRAVRPIPAKGKTFLLTLPVVDASVRPASALVVADAENIKSTLEPIAETATRPIPPERREALPVPEPFRGLRQIALRIDSAVQAFDAKVVVEKQEIETEATAHLEVQEGRLQVTERISYHVAYERLAEATLVLPKELKRGDVQFYLDRNDSDIETIPSWTAGEADSGDVVANLAGAAPHWHRRHLCPLLGAAGRTGTERSLRSNRRSADPVARRRIQGHARRPAGSRRHRGRSHRRNVVAADSANQPR